MMPPAVMRIHIMEHGERKLHLWLPIGVMWPLLGLLGVLLLPFLLLLGRGRRPPHLGRWLLPMVPVILDVLCQLKGLLVRVGGSGGETQVLFRVD